MYRTEEQEHEPPVQITTDYSLHANFILKDTFRINHWKTPERKRAHD